MTNEEDFYKRELVTTKDGSGSIFLPNLNEHYHSHHGAVQESKHVFMKMGWSEFYHHDKGVNILEVGFGTGLNAYLVLCDHVDNQVPPDVFYTAIELFPLESDLVAQLDYWKAGPRSETENKKLFLSLHEATWENPVKIYPTFILEKLKTSLSDFVAARKFDLIFFDAFAPRVQPEMWTKEVFDKLYVAMNPGGILVTYCSKGEVRRNMIAAGFEVEKVPGPPGKREMLRARVPKP
jgi:tRNA U34 5-methylaminomethyl-2-thiouridine-forming methyltransferase MnmC